MPTLADLKSLGAPSEVAWEIREDNTVRLDFSIRIDGVAVDLTGVTGTCKIRADYDAATDLATPTVTLASPATIGRVYADLDTTASASLSAAVPVGTSPTLRIVPIGVYDVVLTDGTNTITAIAGTVSLVREVTP